MQNKKFTLLATIITFLSLAVLVTTSDHPWKSSSALAAPRLPPTTEPKTRTTPIQISQFNGPSQDGCGLWDQYFARTFYNTSGYDDVTYADFSSNINDIWNTGSPVTNIAPDRDWSAMFNGIYYNINADPVIQRVYPTFQGTVEILIENALVFQGTNNGPPREFIGADSPVLDNINPHHIQVRFVNNNNPEARLILKSEVCWADDRTICNSKDLFYKGTVPVPSDVVYYTEKPSGTSGKVGDTAYFNVGYVSQPSAGVQWQRKQLSDTTFKNTGSSVLTLNHTVESGDDQALFRAQVSSARCSLFDRISNATLSVTTATPTPDPSTSPTPTPTPGALSCSVNPSTAKTDEDVIITGTGGDQSKYRWSSDGIPPTCNDFLCTTHPAYRTHWISPGTKTITLRHDLLPDAMCTVEITGSGTPTPTPTPAVKLACSGPSTLSKGQEGEFIASGGLGNPVQYYWTANFWSPSTETGSSFKTKQMLATGNYEIEVTDGYSKSACKVNVVAPTPTPLPPLQCQPGLVEVQPNEEAVFTAEGGNEDWYYWGSDGNSGGRNRFGQQVYRVSFADPGEYEVTLESLNLKAFCTVKVAYISPTPIPSDPACSNPDCAQDVNAFVYNYSPISLQDQSGDCYPTPDWPSECDPHQEAFEPFMRINNWVEGLALGARDEPHAIEVVASPPELTIQDALPDNKDLAEFSTSSMFDENLQPDYKKQVFIGQANAYKVIAETLLDFTSRVWEAGPVNSELWFKPAEFPLIPLKVVVDEGNSFPVLWQRVRDVIRLGRETALDRENIIAQFYKIIGSYFIEDNGLDDGTTSEKSVISQAFAMYFGVNLGDDQEYYGDYTARSAPNDHKHKIMGRSLDIIGVRHPRNKTLRTVDDTEDYAERVVYVLTSMRLRVGERFDQAVIAAYSTLADAPYTNNGELGDISFVQTFYIELYEYMNQIGYSLGDLSYFKNDLVGGMAEFKVVTGNTTDIDAEDMFFQAITENGPYCLYNDQNQLRPVVIATIPATNSVGSPLSRVNFSISYENVEDPIDFAYDKMTEPIFSQPTMHTPMNATDPPDFVTMITLPYDDDIDEVEITVSNADFINSKKDYDTAILILDDIEIEPCN